MTVNFLETLEEYHSLWMMPVSVERIMSKLGSCFAVVLFAQHFLLYAFSLAECFL